MESVKKFGFWIGIGLVCIVAIVAQFMVVEPMSASNAALLEKLKIRKLKLETAAKNRELKNEHWIEFEGKRAEVWKRQRKECEEYFLSQQDFPSWFSDDSGRKISSRSLWVTAFIGNGLGLEIQHTETGIPQAAVLRISLQEPS